MKVSGEPKKVLWRWCSAVSLFVFHPAAPFSRSVTDQYWAMEREKSLSVPV